MREETVENNINLSVENIVHQIKKYIIFHTILIINQTILATMQFFTFFNVDFDDDSVVARYS